MDPGCVYALTTYPNNTARNPHHLHDDLVGVDCSRAVIQWHRYTLRVTPSVIQCHSERLSLKSETTP